MIPATPMPRPIWAICHEIGEIFSALDDVAAGKEA
jgi:hypothetical protein